MMAKVLIVGPAWVGDMVMAQSLFKLLKQRNPTVQIDVLAPQWSLPLLARMLEVRDGIVMPLTHGQLKLCQRIKQGKELRAKSYDQAIVLPNSFKAAIVPYFANIPVRTGWSREARFLLLNDVRRLNKKRYPLMIERFMALGLPKDAALPAEYPIPELIISQESAATSLAKHCLTLTRPILALCPGAEFGPAKRWPEEHYAAIANEKIATGYDVWLLGSPKDQTVSAKIMALTQNRCIDLTGKTSLAEAVDLLSLATVVVSNDSGLMHIAAALRKPLVVVYGPTSASFTPPLNSEAKTLSLSLTCQPCFQRECPLKHQRCMRDLLPEQVLQAITKVTTPCVS